MIIGEMGSVYALIFFAPPRPNLHGDYSTTGRIGSTLKRFRPNSSISGFIKAKGRLLIQQALSSLNKVFHFLARSFGGRILKTPTQDVILKREGHYYQYWGTTLE